MKPQNYQFLSRCIYNNFPLIGWMLRLWATWQLAKGKGASQSVAILSEAVTKSRDRIVITIALAALRNLKDKQSIDIVCKSWVENPDSQLKSIIQRYNYEPSETITKALFYFLLGNWQKYESLDFDQTLLIQAYQSASKAAKAEVSKRSKMSTRLELIKILTNANNDFEGEKITDREWEICVDILMIKLDRKEIWRFLCNAPPIWSKNLLEKLANRPRNWFNPNEEAIVRNLLTLSSKTKVESFGTVTYLFSQPFFYKTLTSSNPGGCQNIAVSPDSRILTTDRGEYWSLLDDNHIRTNTGIEVDKDTFTGIKVIGYDTFWDKRRKEIQLYTFPEMKQFATINGASNLLSSGLITISPDRRILVMTCSGSEDTETDWHLNNSEIAGLKVLNIPPNPNYRLNISLDYLSLDRPKFSPNSQNLAIPFYAGKKYYAGKKSGVFLFSFSLINDEYSFSGNKKIIDGNAPIEISPNSRILASSVCGDNTVRLWSLPDGNHLKTLSGHKDRITSLVISPDNRILASISYDRTVRLWSLPDGNHLKTLTGHDITSKKLLISPDGRILASYGAKGSTICLWSLPDGNHLKTFTGHPCIFWSTTSLALSPDGQFLAATQKDKTIRLWSLPDKNYHPSINQFTTQDIADIESKINDPKLEESVHNAFKFTLALIDLRKQVDINSL